MDSGIIISLILGVASIVSSVCFGLVPNVRKQRISKLLIQRDKLFHDVRLFYEIESELLNIVEQTTGENKATVQKRIRKRVSENNNGIILSDYSKPSVFKKYINNGTI